jgi:peptide/nickel transport system permease protein
MRTLTYSFHKLVHALFMIWLLSLFAFWALYVLGDPIELLLHSRMSDDDLQAARQAMGLDQSLWVQYSRYMQDLVQGNFGVSYFRGAPALDLILERLPATLELVFVVMMVSLFVAMPVGLYVGLFPKYWSSRCICWMTILGMSTPAFWVAMIALYIFSLKLGWLPTLGRGPTTVGWLGIEWSLTSWAGVYHIILPALTLGFYKTCLIIRMTASETQRILQTNYIFYARARGMPKRLLIFKYVLRVLMIPLSTILTLELGSLMAFAVITETIFAWPGIGKLLVDSINLLDRPVVVAYILLSGIFFMIIHFLNDILYQFLDPRIHSRRYQSQRENS